LASSVSAKLLSSRALFSIAASAAFLASSGADPAASISCATRRASA
jgi:hypothetical protein